MKERAISFLDLSLPTRNWNSTGLLSLKEGQKKDLSLPTRNWNRDEYSDWITKSSDLSLPTRNWNIPSRIIRPLASLRFEPTYEELKLLLSSVFQFSLNRFEPTYEELKLAPLTSRFRPGLRFEPTYEELKPFFIALPIEEVIPDLSLPTRNWNEIRILSFYCSITLIWAYLRGIETRLIRLTIGSLKPRFEPTYEELKPFKV